MNNFLITDLLGTLIEEKYAYSEKNTENAEYISRINNIGRKLNTFLSENNNVAIMTSAAGHGISVETLFNLLSDVDASINPNIRNRMHYFIAGQDAAEAYENVKFITKNGSMVQIVNRKLTAYESVVGKYPNFHFIAIDDKPNYRDGIFSNVVCSGGETVLIYDELEIIDLVGEVYELKYYNRNFMSFDEYLRYFIIDSFSNHTIPDKETAYRMLYSGKIDMNDFYLLSVKQDLLTLLASDSSRYGLDFSDNKFDRLYKKGIISIEPSFELAFQKCLLPKVKK